jgi:hypothetical protein
LYTTDTLWGPVSLPIEIDPSTTDPPVEYWVHGEELSDAPRDVVFELKWLREGIPELVDTVKVTVWDAEISNCGAQWLPSGTPDAPTTLSFTCTILPEGVVGLTQFSLNSSTMPGYCMNAPLEIDPLASPFDLCFTPGQNGFDSGYREEDPLLWQTATTTQPVSEAEIEVQCKDYGAWGWLQAQVRVEDTLDRAHVPGADLQTTPTIPVDEDENYIADCWDYNEGAATDDEESLEDMGDPNYPGDGLTRYEEYRGFMALGQHIRTNPDDDQDIFLIDRDDLGAGFFANSGLTLQFIDLTEVGIDPATREPQAVNFNCGFAHAMGQHAVIYLDAGYHPDWYGDSGYVGVPSLFPGIAVQIWVAAVRYDSPPTLNDPDTPDTTDADALATVIAHELGHRVAIRHHDPVATGDDDCIMISGADPRWYDPRSIFCTETIPDNPGTPEEVETGACLYRWRLHD